MDINEAQRKIISIVSELSETNNDESNCKLFIDLKPIVEGNFDHSTRLTILSEIWKYEIPHKILSFLREKNTFVSKSAVKACYLCSILVDCCLGYTLDTAYISDFLPDLTYTIQLTLTNMISEYAKLEKKLQSNLCGNISWIVMILGKVAEKFISTSITMVSSKYFMQFLMVEDPAISLIALSFLKKILKTNRNIFYHVAESRAHSIVEELTFKLFGTADDNVAKVSLSALLVLLDVHPSLIELFTTKRYRGFKTYITKLQGKGFNDEIRKMLFILDTQSKRLLATQKEENAAIVIQSCYRGYRLRRRLQNASIAIAKFQKLYKEKKIHKYELKTQEKLGKMKTQYVESDRRKAFVDSRKKQLQTIENIAAKTVSKFLEDHDHSSAKKIQAVWKGYQMRKLLKLVKPEMRREKAAVIIQKQIRKWLERCRSKHVTDLISLFPPGLDDQRKVELQQVIGNIRNRFPVSCNSDAELYDLHDHAFRKLSNHVTGLHQSRRQDERRKALLAQLTVLSDQLSSFPSLETADLSHVEQYSSYSTPVIVAARQQHLDCLNEQKMPWWQKLEKENVFENNLNANRSFHLNEEKQF